MRATAAVPVASADESDLGAPAIVMTPPDSVKDGFCNEMVASTAAKAAEQISMKPTPDPASIAVMTAAMRVDLSVAE
jgi:hypothetical protein